MYFEVYPLALLLERELSCICFNLSLSLGFVVRKGIIS